ncbi:hypothetical protein [Aestuariimicrobium sp. T2.26MG-19.2B]|uniref:hypothetical protein n=1 Tax=Aestuariimicrobium sp. T2.26MG-19.2B TaxID=3040679 RepID=UPI002477B5A3|nr:hypothetical protein [Aestuariimicrobium sp. T2.26MG-19.2B]CAI9398605.1 hypothetical protein AESSP_00024 [Aestuariimicrobium sp. T2.26MG-19.2B]
MPGVVRSDSRLAVVEVDGVQVGITDSVTGGALSSMIVGLPGPGDTINQHVSHPLYEPLSWTMGAALDSGLPDWIMAAVNQRTVPSRGSLSFRSTTGEEAQRLEWGELTELHVAFPLLDATRSERGVVTATLHAGRLHRTAGSPAASATPKEARQPQWLVNNFRLTIDGLDCSRVSRVQPPEVVVTIPSTAVGERREPTGAVSSRVGNLSLQLEDATGFFAWYEDVVQGGNNGTAGERSGRLECLAPDLKQVLFSVELTGLGIMRIAPQWTATSGKPSTTEVDLYCEGLLVKAPTAKQDSADRESLTDDTRTSADPAAGAGTSTTPIIETPLRNRPPIGRTIPDLPPFTRPR